jgi:hypothetical protein
VRLPTASFAIWLMGTGASCWGNLDAVQMYDEMIFRWSLPGI